MSSSTKQRILGTLLGVHAGDALGATYEFQSWAAIRRAHPNGLPRDLVGGGFFFWPPGHATDDTDLTRAVLLAYAASAPSGDPARSPAVALACTAGNHMLDWFDGRWPGRQPGSNPVDVGNATRAGLQRFRATAPPTEPANRDPRRAGAGSGAAGNGSLMRCTPSALFAPSEERLIQETALVSAVTHDDPRCVLACVAYNFIVRALVFDREPTTTPAAAASAAVAAGLAAMDCSGPASPGTKVVRAVADCLALSPDAAATYAEVVAAQVAPAVAAAIENGRSGIRLPALTALGPDDAPGARQALPGNASGFVLESLTLAVAAVLDPRPLPDVLIDVVRVGQDTDTNGAIAGGLLGARDGVDAIPAAWRDKMQFGREFTEIVDRLVPKAS